MILVGRPAEPDLAQALNRGLAALVSADADERADELFVAVHNAFELLEAKARAESRGKWLNRYRYELGELIEIAKAISTEREIDKLLGLILEKSRFITGADAGSLYVVEGDDPEPYARTLRFKLSQNASVAFDSREFTVPISPRSMSGYVALHKKSLNIADVYDLPALAPYGFDRSFDAKVGYRTKSMLCAPLLSRVGDVVGVIQLINKKRDPEKKLLTEEDVAEQVVPFDDRSVELLVTLGAQAGIALENAILYAEIQRMLEGFVRASVEAIEQRDPTTSGHSRRVSELTLALARAVESADAGPYRGVSWSADDLRELEYASLLHDFGKIGVREEVLLKAKKLFPAELETLRARFEFATRSAEVDILSRKVRALERGASAAELEALDQELLRRRRESSTWRSGSSSRPTSRPCSRAATSPRIEALARETYVGLDGDLLPLLQPVGGRVPLGGARLADRLRDRRDPQPRVPHVHVPLADPLGKAVSARRPHRGGAPRAPQRDGLPQPPARRGDPAPVQDDGGERHLRRAHRQRPAVQEGGPRGEGARHPRPGGEGPERGRRPAQDLHRCAGLELPRPRPRLGRHAGAGPRMTIGGRGAGRAHFFRASSTVDSRIMVPSGPATCSSHASASPLRSPTKMPVMACAA